MTRSRVSIIDPQDLTELVNRLEEAEDMRDAWERQCSATTDYAHTLLDRITELETTIQRVRDQHKPVAHNFLAKYCQCGQFIPCRTTQALEGDQP